MQKKTAEALATATGPFLSTGGPVQAWYERVRARALAGAPLELSSAAARFARAGLAGLLAPPEPPPWTGEVVLAPPPRWVGARDPYAQALGDVVRYLCRGPVDTGARQEVSG